ncbi:DUF2000 domain-containing protein [Roseibium litorale]|uniref:DUF2000 domain-containing protein n=1 Tax=Roseibium litorale TaxID=2803841 RepID=A0ABR9CNJ9_9HYPH|nr:DUF2000 domain-containing protein [Roseibium litorale]MBD8891851.1 DUF2000 domain-containing protein [Roseibium litorale]
MTPDLRIAIIVNPELALGALANTASAISVGIGAKMPEFGNRQLSDTKGRAIDISSNHPVPMLQADEAKLTELLLKATANAEGAVVPFPRFARSLHAYRDYEARFPEKDLSVEPLDGLGLAGPAKWVRSLTGSLKLLR